MNLKNNNNTMIAAGRKVKTPANTGKDNSGSDGHINDVPGLSQSRQRSAKNLFRGQVAVITGAASGIGLAVSGMLLEEGASVALLDINEEGLKKSYKKYKSKAALFPIDVTSQSLIDSTVKNVIAQYGKIDILINCAGITGVVDGLSHEVESGDLHRVFELNFMSCFYTSKAVLPFMLKQKYGRILHVSSIAGKEGNVRMLAYSSSKAALIGMTKVQGKEYAGTGITVNAIAPAVVRTSLVDALPDKQVKYMTDKIPMKRCGTLEEVSNLVAYIVSEQNSFTTGFTFDLTGGRATY